VKDPGHGPSRQLERLAQANPGCFVAIEATYDDETQTPAQLTYLVAANRVLTYEGFSNTPNPPRAARHKIARNTLCRPIRCQPRAKGRQSPVEADPSLLEGSAFRQ
jgi:hypothetical protein